MPVSLNDRSADDLNDLRWVKLLPWLDEYVSKKAAVLEQLAPDPDWWFSQTPLETRDDVDLPGLRDKLARIFVARHPNLLFANAFPLVSDSLPLSALALGVRETATLERLLTHGTVGTLLMHSVADLLAVRGTGHSTVEEIVKALLTASLVRQHDTMETLGGDYSEHLPSVFRQLLEDLGQLAQWRRIRGRDGNPLLTLNIEDGAPEEIQELAARISALTPADLPRPVPRPDALHELESHLHDLDGHELIVLQLRTLAVEPLTQSEVAELMGLSQPAVSHIERSVKARLADTFVYGTAVGNLLASMRVEIQPVAALGRLLKLYPEIDQPVPSMNTPFWLALDRIDDYFEVTDGWAAAPGVRDAKLHTRTLLEEVGSISGVVELMALTDVSSMPFDELVDWLHYCGYQILEDRVITRRRRIGDYAASVLEIIGKPMTSVEILALMSENRAPLSVYNALCGDERFVRIGRDTWGLHEWTATDSGAAGHQIRLEIDPAMSEQVDPAAEAPPSSGPTTAIGPQRTSRSGSTVDKIVSRQVRGRVQGRPPEETRQLYRDGDLWRYRLEVTSDQLRGSGFSIPSGVATAAGCDYDGVRELSSRLGTQVVRWTNSRPSMGTIRRFLVDLDVGEGDAAFLEFRPDGSFDVVRTAQLDVESAPLRRALALIGRLDAATVPESDIPRTLADAIALRGEDRPRRILSAFRARGEDDVSELLEAAWLENPT